MSAATDEIDRLIDRSDLDELVRMVDRLVDQGSWDDLVVLRDRCRFALERGRQLWPVASLAEYRLVLQAPLAIACDVVVRNTARFTLGPLTEVLASRSTWAEVEHLLPIGPERAFVAHERVVRGEDLTSSGELHPAVLDLPLVLQAWEPRYAVPHYRTDRIEDVAPTAAATPTATRPGHGRPDAVRLEDDDFDEASRDGAQVWVSQSNGSLDAVAVDGDADDAVFAVAGEIGRITSITPADGLAQLAWAAGSGGAYGRRRGVARARQSLWWLLASIGGWALEETPQADELGELVAGLRWFRWEAEAVTTGWQVRIAIEDAVDGLAWALSITDHA